jgi:hypothetical protein
MADACLGPKELLRVDTAMISELKIRNFKSLESVDLKLGHFNLLVGANASGKSNFLDALRFLEGVGNWFDIDEILDGKPPSATGMKWEGIRGGANSVAFRRPDGSQSEDYQLEVTVDNEGRSYLPSDSLSYSLTCSALTGASSIIKESLYLGASPVFRDEDRPHLLPLVIGAGRLKLYSEASISGWDPPEIQTDSKRGLLAWLASTPKFALEGSKNEHTQRVLQLQCATFMMLSLADMQFLDPLPRFLRDYSSKVTRLGENGEGLAALIYEVQTNGSKPALLEWLKELRSDGVDDVYALEGLNNDFMVAIKEGNKEFRGPVLSEGTLRFLTLAAAFFQPSMPKALVIEEIEKGLHPSRLRLLLELMRSQSKRTGTQVFATTHSPALLNWLTKEDRKTTFVCTRDEQSGATKMRALTEIPRLEELVQKNYNLDQLFEEGWLESALHEP